MVMEESNIHHHSPAGENNNANNTNNNVYLVGLEFVRQYYTVLNQGPLYLHRFYSDDSSFVHGVSARDSKVAYGQQEIHKRIQSLNFHNCHAKIRQVDSHETLGNGVVIQVTGELSNNGQPMRRFMQTFVLAPQNPKRYYVRNDIFHYQDEIFCDDEGEPDTPPESTPVDTEEADELEKEGDINGGSEIIAADPASPVSTTVTLPKLSPGGVTPPTVSATGNSPNNLVEVIEEKVQVKPVDTPALSSNQQSGAGDEDTVVTVKPPVVTVPAPEEEQPVNNTSNSGPKTYANLFKSGSSVSKPNKLPTEFKPAAGVHKPVGVGSNGPSGGSPGNAQVTVSVNDGGVTSPPQVSPLPSSTGVNKGLPPRNPPRNQAYNRDRGGDRDRPGGDRDGYQNRRERLISRSSTTLNDETGSVDGDRRRPVNSYPDNHQLFVGNLPHFVTPQDMKDIFSEFGEVAEVKIQKPMPKSTGVKVPYFCFVVFEDAASAQLAIEKKGEIFMKLNGGAQRRLNVEPKRSQRSGRGGEDSDAPYNRMDAASPAGNRPSDGMRSQSRTFRGSNRSGMSGDRDRGGNSGRGGLSDRGRSERGGGGGRN
ncbi:unnamed protein product [Orchesella dallaii]|uniref:Ras GTPase-activating protein-binding protein 2 n=1 Tax=Orchesella dallaii TaxID=48710 RepID=A0ABP1QKB4_9HEXA